MRELQKEQQLHQITKSKYGKVRFYLSQEAPKIKLSVLSQYFQELTHKHRFYSTRYTPLIEEHFICFINIFGPRKNM